MIVYVLGFAFNLNQSEVVLIEKQKPEWQRGLLNGVGGKWNGAVESIPEAMVREFYEEAGVLVPLGRWAEFCRMGSEQTWRCHCYSTLLSDEEFGSVDTCESEVIVTCPSNIQSGIIKNLRWLIPMAKDKLRDPSFEIGDVRYQLTNETTNEKCLCGCCHSRDLGACPEFEEGGNGRCVYCDHGKVCHPGTPRRYNTPLGVG